MGGGWAALAGGLMPAFLLGRLASLILSLIAASVVIFLILEVVPGDPAQFMLGMNAEPQTLAALRDGLPRFATPISIDASNGDRIVFPPPPADGGLAAHRRFVTI